MSYLLNPGDRMRVTAVNRLPGYRPGEKGTVIQGVNPPWHDASSFLFYLVHMDKDSTEQQVLFWAGEIEADI